MGGVRESEQGERIILTSWSTLCEFFFYFRYAFVLNNSEKNVWAERQREREKSEKTNQQKKVTLRWIFFVSLSILPPTKALQIETVL